MDRVHGRVGGDERLTDHAGIPVLRQAYCGSWHEVIYVIPCHAYKIEAHADVACHAQRIQFARTKSDAVSKIDGTYKPSKTERSKKNAAARGAGSVTMS